MPGIGIGIGIPFRNISPLYDWMKIPFYAIDNIVLSAVVGEEFVLYGDTLTNLPIKNNLFVIYTSDIGISSDNNYNLTPSISDIGEHTINVKFKNLGRLFLEKNITLRVVEKNPVGSRKILMIGDSLMSQGGQSYATEIKSILTNNTLTFVGTIGTTDKFEGYSGATWYSFITGGHGKFYKDGALNIPAYFTDYSIDTPDYVFIRLGVNDTFGFCNINTYPNGISDANITTILNNAKILIDAFLDFDSNLKIILGIPTISENTGAGWNNNYNESIYNQDLYIQNMHKYWITFLNTFANGIYDSRVDCSFEVFNLDRDNGYPKTDGIHTNGLHPNTTVGYPQLGGGMAIYFDKEITKSLSPTNLIVSWVDDYAELSWGDNTSGTAVYEIYESENNETFTLIHTTDAGATSYNHYTEQNKTLYYKVIAKVSNWYSEFSNTCTISTPLVFISDQTTLTTLTINTLNINTGGTVNVDWGDGTNANYSEKNSTITKNYSTTGLKYVKLTGDVNSIARIDIRNQSKVKGSLTKWNRPTSLTYMDLLSCSLTGNWTNNNFISGLIYIQIGQAAGAGLSGDWSDFIINQSLSAFNAAASISTNKASGDLSGWIIPSTCRQVYIPFHNFTKLPRGNFLGLNETIGMYANSNNCDQTEIDNFLIYLQSFFTTNTPIKNQLYKLDGAGMAIPSATGLAAKAAVEQLFINAGYTVTININS